MCVILVGRVSKAQHELAVRQNPDGFSVFTPKLGLVKSPTKAQVKEALNHFAIWHYRIGTSGKKGDYNVHPFEICGGKFLLYHNGILGEGLGDMSDTHALAETLKDVDIKVAMSVLNALKDRQRFLVVSATNPKDFRLIGDWSCDGGVLMSHKLYSYSYKECEKTLSRFSLGGDDNE